MLQDLDVENEEELLREIAEINKNIDKGKQVKKNTERKEKLMPLLNLIENKKTI
jgi:hypothetical protein